MQLEEEYEDKQKVLREKRELESKLSAVSEQVRWGAARHMPCFGDPEVAMEGWVPRQCGALARSPLPQANQRDFETEKRLRRDLKRTKALLADAQIMLDHLKNNAPSKREIAQLKNQVCIQTPPKTAALEGHGVSLSPGWPLSRVPAAGGVGVHLRSRRQGPQVHGGGDRRPPPADRRPRQGQGSGKCFWGAMAL